MDNTKDKSDQGHHGEEEKNILARELSLGKEQIIQKIRQKVHHLH